MTKEETLAYIKAYLDGDTAVGNIIPLRSVLESAIKYLEPSLPSNLDEAAEEIASSIAPTHPDIDWDECFEKIKEGIKAGAEWMAGQGESIVAKIGLATEKICCTISEKTLDSLGVRAGDEIIVQIRKKQ